MKILRHRLHADDGTPVALVPSPNSSGKLHPRYLVIHFTAGRSPQESVSWLTNAAARASAHLVIGRDGSVTQLLPFDRVAWHAGASEWEGLSGLNRHSIGIELDNAGRLTRQGMAWRAWFGTPYVDEEVMEAVHKHELSPSAWHMFTPEQLQAAFEVSLCIVQKYDLRDVVGHDDISPGRKCDPGPAFPLASFRSRLLGRADDDAPPFETTGVLNIRVAPGTQHAKLDVSPLPAATPLEVVRKEEGWWLVNVKVEIGGETDVQGWVHGSFVRRVE